MATFFEEVKISQQRNGVLLTSFYIFLHSSILFRWWCYLKDNPSGFGCELFNYLLNYLFLNQARAGLGLACLVS